MNLAMESALSGHVGGGLASMLLKGLSDEEEEKEIEVKETKEEEKKHVRFEVRRLRRIN